MSSYRKKRPQPRPAPARQEWQEQLAQQSGEATYNNPGVDKVIHSSRLISGQAYQRPVREEKVNDLIQKWDETMLEPIVVSFRDGKFYVIDGQNRISAMRKMNGGHEVMVLCKVHTGMTYQDEAEMCWKLDQAKQRMDMAQSVNALSESGTNAEITDIRQILEREGFRWALSRKTGKAYEVASTRAVINAYRLLGGAAFDRMFRLLAETWRGVPRSLNSYIISGMALFLKTYETEVKDRTFIIRLSAVDPEEIIRRGKIDFSTSKAALRYARVILEKYNGQRGGGKLQPRLLG